MDAFANTNARTKPGKVTDISNFVNGTPARVLTAMVFIAWAAMTVEILAVNFLPWRPNFSVIAPALTFFVLMFFVLLFFLLPKINQILSRASNLSFWPLVIIFSLAARIAVFSFIPTANNLGGDVPAYHNLALNLAETGTLVHSGTIYGETSFYALWPPGYPLLLSVPYYLFGNISFGALLLNSAIFLVLLAGVIRLSDALFSRTTGRWAAVILALNPTLLILGSIPHKETLIASLCVWIAVAWLKLSCSIHGNSRWALLGGGLSGYLMLAQPSFAPLAALIIGSLYIRHGTLALRPLLLACCVAGLILGAWSWRNYLIFDAFVPLTNASGHTLWIGLNPQTSSSWQPLPESFHNLPELEMNARARAAAFESVRNNPAILFRNTPFEHFVTWGRERVPAVYVAHVRGWDVNDDRTNALAIILQIYYTMTVTIAAAYVLSSLRRRRIPPMDQPLSGLILCLVLIFIYFSILISVNEAGERHHYFSLPFLSMFAAQFLHMRATVSRAPSVSFPA